MRERDKNARIIIVEDEIIVSTDLAGILKNLGYTILAAVDSGEELIKIIENKKPDIVLMDIILAGRMDGIEAAEAIRKSLDIPIIYITAHADEKTIERSKETDPAGYILKPFNPNELYFMIETAVYKYRLERILRESEKRYRAIVEDQTELICRLLPDGTLTFTNGAFCRYFSADANDCVGKNLADYFGDEEKIRMKKDLSSLSVKNSSFASDLKITKQGKNVRWLSLTARAIPNEFGDITEIQCVILDRTENIMSEQLLQIERDIALILNSSFNLPEMCSRILQKICMIEGIDCGGIYLASYPQKSLELIAHHGFSTSFVKATSRYEADAPETQIVMKGDPIYLKNNEMLPSLDKIRQKENLRSVASIPIEYQGQIQAAFNLGSHKYDEIPLYARNALEAVAAQIGGTIVRLKIETALKESRGLYQQLVEKMRDGLVMVDNNGSISYANPRICEMIGYSKDEIIGRSLSDFLDDKNRSVLDDQLKRRKKGEREPYELEWLTKKGERIITIMSPQVVYDDEGNFSGSFAVITDITERKHAERQLIETNETLLAIINSSPPAIFSLDVLGNIITWSPSAEKIFGWNHDEAAGRFIPIVPDIYMDEFRKNFRNILKGKWLTGHETRRQRKDGSLIDVSISAAPLRGMNGEIIGGLEIIDDITHRKEAEENLKKAMLELEKKNKELEHFAYIASHDLRQPLRLISGYIELLAKRYIGKLDSDAEKFISRSIDGVKQMEELIKDLLDFSLMDTQNEKVQRINCVDVLEKALLNLQEDIRDNDAEITYDPLPEVTINELQLLLLFQNLIGNAIKFRGKKQPKIHISASQNSSEWIFSVKDNGIGIEPDFHERIFIIFERLHTRDKYPGTGIGLATCKRIVERFGGRISVDSEPGKGSVFSFTIPMKKGAGAAKNGSKKKKRS